MVVGLVVVVAFIVEGFLCGIVVFALFTFEVAAVSSAIGRNMSLS